MDKPSATALEQANEALKQGLIEHHEYPHLLSVRDGCIQRFEVAIDLSWKLMQRVLKEVFGLQQTDIRTKEDLFRESEKNGLIADAEEWIEHYEARNLTSHTYNADTANEVFELVPDLPVLVSDFLERLARVN
jgi:nucleotidyltransferase substrate binding protein (TIGR01987 family)